ncbi:MAG: hypothetical protein IPK74_16480 [Deltaproteobacteria bacterium]|nr:hypothetical protein [Deltaproteobacteria bacterium]
MPASTSRPTARRFAPRVWFVGALVIAHGSVATRAHAGVHPSGPAPTQPLAASTATAPTRETVAAPAPDAATAPDATSAPYAAPEPDAGSASAPLGADAIAAQLGRDVRPQATAPPEPIDVMRARGVEDPFPDRVPTVNRRHTGVLVGLGFASAAAAIITARMTLLPDCGDERDASTCRVPDGADIGVRWGRAFATVGFAAGGAAFGALGGRSLAAGLASDDTRVRRPERVAVALGGTGLALGVAALAVGAGVFGWGARQSMQLGRTFTSTDTIDDPAVLARVDRTLAHIRVARAGLMTMAVAPMLLASGIALLRHRPRERAIAWAPAISRRMVGVAATVRF